MSNPVVRGELDDEIAETRGRDLESGPRGAVPGNFFTGVSRGIPAI